MSERPDPLIAVVEPALARLDLHLYDLELVGRGTSRILRVTIDRGEGDDRGIDLDAITAATEALSAVLDHDPAADSVLRGAYTLEVSSPGLERSLRTPEHFRRAMGTTVSVKTGVGPDARRRRGTVAVADDAGFDLVTDDGTREHIAYGDVVQARTVFEWGPAPKSKRGKQKVAS